MDSYQRSPLFPFSIQPQGDGKYSVLNLARYEAVATDLSYDAAVEAAKTAVKELEEKHAAAEAALVAPRPECPACSEQEPEIVSQRDEDFPKIEANLD